MRIKYFNQIFEDIYEMSDEEFNSVFEKVKMELDKYKSSILDNISYNIETNKIEYEQDFDNINIKSIISELNSNIGEDIIKQFNVEAFLRKIYQIIDLKKRNTIKNIKEEFRIYYLSLEDRFKNRQLFVDTGKDHFDEFEGEISILPRKRYEREKYNIQVELLKLQEWCIKKGKRIAIVFEGRDSAGKGSTIKRFIEYLNPKYFRVVALGVPTEEEKNNWFARYEKHLPKPGEIVFFDRSWYNRAVVEPAMGYCNEEQYMDFIENVLNWEEKLIKDDLILIKFWFSITKEKQQLRFELRKKSPLKYWKFSPNDAKVVDKWDIITNYKNQMFNKTSSAISPWVIINSNDKKIGRLNAMRYILSVIDYDDKDDRKSIWYPEVVNVLR